MALQKKKRLWRIIDFRTSSSSIRLARKAWTTLGLINKYPQSLTNETESSVKDISRRRSAVSFEHVWQTSNIGYAVGNIGCRCARRAVPEEGKVKITGKGEETK